MEFLVSLRRETMWAHVEHSGHPLDEAEQLDRVLHRLDCAQIVTRVGADIGLLKVARDTKPWELVQIQLLPQHQGHGIGETLLKGLLDEARRANDSVGLEVFRANPARRLYERLGFRIVSESTTAYQMLASPAREAKGPSGALLP